MPKPFLHLVADTLIQKHGEELSQICIVLPSRRASLFLRRALAESLSNPVLGPNIIVVESLASELSGLDQTDSLTLQFTLYKSYCNILGDKAEGFESFIKWSSRLLQDFNEIDRYAIEAKDLYANLLDAKTLERWGVESETPDLMEKYLTFWRNLYPIYIDFKKQLKERNRGYQGMIYRQAADLIQSTNALKDWMVESQAEHLYFVGFNALNASEKIIINAALDLGVADIWFDADPFYLNDADHEAGMFMRQYKSWKYFDNKEFSFVRDTLRAEKREIEIIGVPRQMGMAKTLSEVLEEVRPALKESEITDRLALVLADEGLLIPALNSIPAQYDKINVTMGLPLNQLSLANAVEILIQTHERALRLMLEESRPFQIYHKDLERLLLHPFFQKLLGENGIQLGSKVLSEMRRYNVPFVNSKKINDWLPDARIFTQLISEQNPKELLEKLAETLAIYHDSEGVPVEDVEASFRLYNVCKNLAALFHEFEMEVDITTTLHLYRQLVREESLDFFGEPLEGLQVMGILETRLLSFDHLIVTSVNEDILPAGRSDNSFIPLDLKRYFGLPTHREKDAIYAYHFYRLLQGAKNVTLLYNTESDGMSSGEASRFIEQIRKEFIDFSNTTITEKVFSTQVEKSQLAQPFQLERGEFLLDAFKVRAEKGIAPSHLQLYVKDPSQFYKVVVLGQQELDEVEEVLGDRSMGVVIHNTLERFYKDFVGSRPEDSDYEQLLDNLESLIAEEYEKENKRKLEREGKNLLAAHAMIGMTRNFIVEERKRAAVYKKNGQNWIIEGVEDKLTHELKVPGVSFPILIKGFADRIDSVDGALCVIDYKSGSTEAKHVTVKSLEEVIENEEKSKALQLFTYAWLLSKKYPTAMRISAGIFALRANKQGMMKATFAGKPSRNEINSTDLQTFESLLTSLLQDIFSTEGVIKPKDQELIEEFD